MATAKKPAKKASPAKVTKTTAIKKATTVKKTAPKKVAAAKTTPKSATKSAATSQSVRSFRLAREQQSFSDFQITRQTVYWIVLIAFIIFAQLWILKLQVEVASLLDQQQNELQQTTSR